MPANLRWLHISDIHFSKKNELRDQLVRTLLVQYLKTQFEEGLARPDLIFCTGDIAFGETSSHTLAMQYEAAAVFFDELLTLCGLNKDRLYLVPGNHDTNRLEADPSAQKTWTDRGKDSRKYIDDFHKEYNDVSKDTVKFALNRLSAFGAFETKYLAREHDKDEKDRHFFAKTIALNGVTIGIAGFNSALTCYGETDDRTLWMGARWQLDKAATKLKNANMKIGLIHHPRDWLNEAERRILKKRVSSEFDFWLHGHTHDIWVDEGASDACQTIGSGAVNADVDPEFGINLVDLDLVAGKGKVHLFALDNTSTQWGIKTMDPEAPNAIWPIECKVLHTGGPDAHDDDDTPIPTVKPTGAQSALWQSLASRSVVKQLIDSGFVKELAYDLDEQFQVNARSVFDRSSLYQFCFDPRIEPMQLVAATKGATTALILHAKRNPLSHGVQGAVIAVWAALSERVIHDALRCNGNFDDQLEQPITTSSAAYAAMIAAVWVYGAKNVAIDVGLSLGGGHLEAAGKVEINPLLNALGASTLTDQIKDELVDFHDGLASEPGSGQVEDVVRKTNLRSLADDDFRRAIVRPIELVLTAKHDRPIRLMLTIKGEPGANENPLFKSAAARADLYDKLKLFTAPWYEGESQQVNATQAKSLNMPLTIINELLKLLSKDAR